mmetsp:Transcript_19429/g.21729  ORF Transcript_19429/g.21729 Transcript_19429/m.21729 type:complete len:124 (-) Transcript_19429:227-598(-)|eukprot:CAMPEP_0205821562 /NCGR_PEP_ID=MMETSP0206-20130828/8495_1 /ASSEMBLY_ACC=CAM_ASM_000279 /TAXON_ID=36767 /ORGANISM="Euplotes focardii, Strain TN1" /LENGTH=123 /DNA_ID=CAMNT_0053117129 /DNA_START=25 /DNA_END=396 /DNA_ORIENTATION=+
MPKISAVEHVEEAAERTQDLIGASNWNAAIQHCCEVCPPKSKEAHIRALAGGVFGSVLQAVPSDQIADVIAALDTPQKTLVMKYTYKAMGSSEECAKLLKWHGALMADSGRGIICRALADRKI